MDKVLPHARRRQVFSLLAEHGPLSKRGLMACLEPPIARRRLYEVLQRLLEGRLLTQRLYRGLGKSAFFYEISKEPRMVDAVSQIIGKDLTAIRSPYFRRIELIHSENCAIWKEVFKRLFPQARIIREHEFYGNGEVSQLLLSQGNDRETDPDLLLIFESKVDGSPISVAIEIERNPKSKVRLARKLRKYAAQSRLDGVIYICEEHSLSERLRGVYNSWVLRDALRVKQYGSNFILFSDGAFDQGAGEPMMFNAALESVSLKTWMHKLLNTACSSRRDLNFRSPAL